MSITSLFSNSPTFADVLPSVPPLPPSAAPSGPNTSTAPLSLGAIDFDADSIPEGVKIGTKQALNVHRLIGGNRVVDAMGSDPHSIAWAGYFIGQDAQDRAQALQAMAREGQEQSLAWGTFDYDVVVQDVSIDIQQFALVRYEVSCEILNVNDISSDTQSLEDAVTQDLNSATAFMAANFGNSTTLAANVSADASNAVAAVSNAQATFSTVSTVTAANASTVSMVASLTSAATSLSGIVSTANKALTSLQVGVVGETTTQTINKILNAGAASKSIGDAIALSGFVGRALNNISGAI